MFDEMDDISLGSALVDTIEESITSGELRADMTLLEFVDFLKHELEKVVYETHNR